MNNNKIKQKITSIFNIQSSLLVFVLAFLVNCSSNVSGDDFKEDLNYYINNGWDNISLYKFSIDSLGTYTIGDEKNVMLRATKNDTNVFFQYLKKNKDLYDPHFFKRYKTTDNDKGNFEVIKFYKNDTLYHFRSTSDDIRNSNFDEIYFIRGKYYYLNLYGKFNNGQEKYYDKFRDSLNKVRGNNLPELIEINE